MVVCRDQQKTTTCSTHTTYLTYTTSTLMAPPTKETLDRLVQSDGGYGTSAALQALLDGEGNEQRALDILRGGSGSGAAAADEVEAAAKVQAMFKGKKAREAAKVAATRR